MYNIDYSKLTKDRNKHIMMLSIFASILILMLLVTLLDTVASSYSVSTPVTKVTCKEVLVEDEDDPDYNYYTFEYTYHYEVDGKKYKYRLLDEYAEDVDPETVTIYYDPEDPKDCIASFERGGFFWIILLTFIFAKPMFDAVKGIATTQGTITRLKRLAVSGKLLKNQVCGVRRSYDKDYVLTGYVLQVRYETRAGDVKVLESLPFEYVDDMNAIEEMVENPRADLLIDESNPNNYYIGLDIDERRIPVEETKKTKAFSNSAGQTAAKRIIISEKKNDAQNCKHDDSVFKHGNKDDFVESERRRERANGRETWL